MKTILFDLSTEWYGVISFFKEFLEEDFEEKKCYSYVFDVHKVSIYWLAQRLYSKHGLISSDALGTRVPFEVELAITYDSDTLLSMDNRLLKFDNYLNFINIGYYDLSKNVDLKVINRVMIINER